jgi:hypothetical protein
MPAPVETEMAQDSSGTGRAEDTILRVRIGADACAERPLELLKDNGTLEIQGPGQKRRRSSPAQNSASRRAI